MSRIGFIGLGNMGAPMAVNLGKAGHDVLGFDVAGVRVEGVVNAKSAAEAAGAELVITMLPDGPIVRSVYKDIVEAAAPGSCLVDCSTIDVESSRVAHGMAKEAGLLSVDAPVSGGVGGAEVVWRALDRKALAYGTYPIAITLTPAGLEYEILHGLDH